MFFFCLFVCFLNDTTYVVIFLERFTSSVGTNGLGDEFHRQTAEVGKY